MSRHRQLTKEQREREFSALSTQPERIKFLLQYSVLAPSTHNIQPWFFSLKENSCEFFLNKKAYLPQADPTTRDAHISLGCCVENFVTAASYHGLDYDIRHSFDKSRGLIVEVVLPEKKGESANPSLEYLMKGILGRVNTRGKFANKDIDQKIIESLLETKTYLDQVRVDFVSDKNTINKLAQLTARGMKLAHAQREFRLEMSGYIIHNYSKKTHGIPGYAMKMPSVLSLFLPSLIGRFNFGWLLSKLNYQSISSAPLLCVISSPSDSPEGWFNTGRVAQRIMLKASGHDLKSSIYVAAVEIADLYEQVKEVLAISDRPHFLMCLGHMNGKPKFTPRCSVESKILST